jgi:hypothetical protein
MCGRRLPSAPGDVMDEYHDQTIGSLQAAAPVTHAYARSARPPSGVQQSVTRLWPLVSQRRGRNQLSAECSQGCPYRARGIQSEGGQRPPQAQMLQAKPSAFHLARASKTQKLSQFVPPAFLLCAFPCLRPFANAQSVVTNAPLGATYGYAVTKILRIQRCLGCMPIGRYGLSRSTCGIERRSRPRTRGEVHMDAVADAGPDSRTVWGLAAGYHPDCPQKRSTSGVQKLLLPRSRISTLGQWSEWARSVDATVSRSGARPDVAPGVALHPPGDRRHRTPRSAGSLLVPQVRPEGRLHKR